MNRRAWNTLVALAVVVLLPLAAPAHAAKDKAAAAKPAAKPDEPKGDDKPFDQVVKDMDEVKGLFTFYRRADDNKVYLEILPSQLDKTYLFTTSIDRSTGERGFYSSQMSLSFPFTFHRVGKTVQWVVRNTSFVADTASPAARSVGRGFTDGLLAAPKLLSKPHPERKSLLVDVSDLLATRDYPGFANALSGTYAPTTYTFDKDKTVLDGVQAFPENVIVDVAMHFQTDNFKSTTTTLADARSVQIFVKYQFSSLPAAAWKPRLADDRVGHFVVVRQDFTSDRNASPYVRYIQRWRLEKQDPSAPLSVPKQPITYWLENTIPLEYRDAVRAGILMWNPAFERIGFKDAIVVKQMPDTATWSPADVRYSTIRWFDSVDATFAIGPRRTDPSTGEILDADIGISEGIVRNARRFTEEYLAPAAAAGSGGTGAARTPAGVALAGAAERFDQCAYGEGLAEQAALGFAVLEARGTLDPALEQRMMREYVTQIVAHEVGHTLGLRHNFHASTLLPTEQLMDDAKVEQVGQAASLMDYNPLIVAAKGTPQGHFVPVTLGPYDYWAIEYAYRPVDGDESAVLAQIASRGSEPALQYATDEDANGNVSPLAMDPLVSQFDASADPLAYFRQRISLVYELWGTMETRLTTAGDGYQILRRAVTRSFNDLSRSLVTSSKFVGGVYTHRDHVGDPQGRPPFEPVAAAKQREALDLLARYAFGEKAFVPPASLANKLTTERIPSLDPAYYATVRLDYPWHDQAMRIQKSVLDRLYHPVTLARLQDSEILFAKPATPFRMADLFAGVDNAIWSELDGPATAITSMRRNVQREQLRQLVRMTLREGTTVVDAGVGPVPVPLPEDATTLARASLVKLQAKMRAKLAGKATLDPTTRAHLQESQARIGQALAASMQRKID